MTPRTLRLALLAVVFVAQLVYPAFLLGRHEKTLAEGDVLCFPCRMTDAAGALQGRYLVLDCPPLSAPTPPGERYLPGEPVYFRFAPDEERLARPAGASRERPEQGIYLRARAAGWSEANGVAIDLPFDRYYLGEELAALAAQSFGASGDKVELEARIDVRLRNGRAVLEELYLGDLPVRDYFEREAAGSD